MILTELIQADEPSPFPALTQIELFVKQIKNKDGSFIGAVLIFISGVG